MAELAGEIKGVEGHVELEIIAAPDAERQQKEFPTPFHRGDTCEPFPQIKALLLDLAHGLRVAEDVEKAPAESSGSYNERPEFPVVDKLHNSAANRIFHHKSLKGRRCHHQAEEQKQEHHQRVGKSVADHRSEHRGERGFLESGHVGAAPHFAQSREDKVKGVAAENGTAKCHKGRTDAQGIQLQLPTGRAEDVGEDADKHRQQDPAVVHAVADEVPHVGEVDFFKHVDHQQHGQCQRQTVAHTQSENLLPDRFLGFCVFYFHIILN